ncbi:MAG TPA: ABC transporter substrate-binding protein [bacterium]|nr:ABC transporter substrate-binding protein [bacterium]
MALAAVLLLMASGVGVAQSPGSDLDLTVKYGVLVALTGPSGASGQLWNQATAVGVAYVNKALKEMGLSSHVKAQLIDSQDSQSQAASGVEGARKLVFIDHANVVMGDILSAVTAAVATSVTIPNHVVEFTGGTATSLPDINPKGIPPLLYQPPASNALEGVVLSQIMAAAFGKRAAVNVAAENDAYGAGLAADFKTAWTASGGTIPQYILYNETQPTLDTAAQQLVQGSPAGWLIIDFCSNLPKLVDPLQRTGKWRPDKTFGGDTLSDCKSQGQTSVPGMRVAKPYVGGGSTLPQYQAYYEQTASGGGGFQGWTAEAFDSVIVSFLAAVQAKSADPAKFAQYIVPLTNPPGTKFTFLQLDKAIAAILRGEKVQYEGVSGPLNFLSNGATGAPAFQIFEIQPDGTSRVVKELIVKTRRP